MTAFVNQHLESHCHKSASFDTCFHVVTGGPGSGKTTLLKALARQGIPHMPEAGRAIIRDQIEIGGTALPWRNRHAFAELMLSWELRSWHEASRRNGHILFDRGIPDVIGYLRLCDLPVPSHLDTAARRFRYQQVFIAPPWAEIYTQDAERKQTFEESSATYDVMIETYQHYGYTLRELPRTPVEDRTNFVMRSLRGNTSPHKIDA
ncbi:AAA family ATPase [Nguyenibacter vanlangensis]|uniref:AAA family ATPase n=1 Tax=Nguyenibacter vanlangensis TaxID=1216886 RepID=A0ABZ3D4I9_9PROT